MSPLWLCLWLSPSSQDSLKLKEGAVSGCFSGTATSRLNLWPGEEQDQAQVCLMRVVFELWVSKEDSLSCGTFGLYQALQGHSCYCIQGPLASSSWMLLLVLFNLFVKFLSLSLVTSCMGSIAVLMAFVIHNLVEPTYTGQSMNGESIYRLCHITTGGQLIPAKSGGGGQSHEQLSLLQLWVFRLSSSIQSGCFWPFTYLRIDEQDHSVVSVTMVLWRMVLGKKWGTGAGIPTFSPSLRPLCSPLVSIPSRKLHVCTHVPAPTCRHVLAHSHAHTPLEISRVAQPRPFYRCLHLGDGRLESRVLFTSVAQTSALLSLSWSYLSCLPTPPPPPTFLPSCPLNS